MHELNLTSAGRKFDVFGQQANSLQMGMLCYHIAHLLPGLCLHDCWFLFYWPIVGSRMFEGKRRIFWGGFVSVDAWAWLCKLREGCEGQGMLLVPTVFFFVAFYIDWHNQHHTLFLVNPSMPACIFWKKTFPRLWCVILLTFFWCFFLSHTLFFPLSFRRWSKVGLFWFDALHAKLLWLFSSVF